MFFNKQFFILIYNFIVIFLFSNNFQPLSQVFGGGRYENIIGKKVIVIENEVTLFENIDTPNKINFNNSTIVKFGEILEIIDLYNKYNDFCFKNDAETVLFYKVKTINNLQGWIKSSSFGYPYLKTKEGIISINEEVYYINEIKNLTTISNLTFSNGKQIIKLQLEKFYQDKGYENRIHNMRITANDIKLKDINNDEKNEIILIGYYWKGLWASDIGLSTESEAWFSFNNILFKEIFIKRFNGEIQMFGFKWEFNYNYIKDKNNFINKIVSTFIKYFTEDGKIWNENEKIIVNYIWDNGQYKILYTPKVNNLRLREIPSLDGKPILSLNKGDKLEYIFYSKKDSIDNINDNWMYVKTNNGTEGYCFGGYLKEY